MARSNGRDDEYSSETDQPVIDDQGDDTDLGGYSNPDGTVGYSNNTSGSRKRAATTMRPSAPRFR